MRVKKGWRRGKGFQIDLSIKELSLLSLLSLLSFKKKRRRKARKTVPVVFINRGENDGDYTF